MTTSSSTTATAARRKILIVPENMVEEAKDVCPDADVFSFEDQIEKAGSSGFVRIELISNPTHTQVEKVVGGKTKKVNALESAEVSVLVRINDLLPEEVQKTLTNGKNRWGHPRVVFPENLMTPEIKEMLTYHKDLFGKTKTKTTNEITPLGTKVGLGTKFGNNKRVYHLVLKALSNALIGFELDTKESESDKKDENGSPYKFFKTTSFTMAANLDGSGSLNESFKWETARSIQTIEDNAAKFNIASFKKKDGIPSGQIPKGSVEVVKSKQAQGEVTA